MIKLFGIFFTFVITILAVDVASAQVKVKFGTNWVAQAEHGGYYQAIADGTYLECGLEVEIVPGGPQVNNRILLPVGKIDFIMGGNLIPAFEAVKQDIPTKVVAASFQKEPQIIMTHPGQNLDTWDSLKSINLLLGKAFVNSTFQWMIDEFGFSLDQIRPYNFNTAPFLADDQLGQQGYITSEPFAVETVGGFVPNIFLIADQGYNSYSTTIETRIELIENQPEVVQCFVDGSAIGWYNYLYGDNSKANELIQTANPEITDAQIEFSVKKMIEYGIVDSGDSIELGIGAMTDNRMKSFFNKMVSAGVLDSQIDYKKSYTLEFVNRGVGLDVKDKLLGN